MEPKRILLMAVIFNKEQETATRDCYNSLSSENHVLDIYVDTRKRKGVIAQTWNEYFQYWLDRGDFEYLMVICNDTLARPESIDYFIKCAEENPDVGILCALFARDKSQFLNSPISYSANVFEGGDAANFIIRKEVLEKVGLADYYFPHEFVERDLFRRTELVGIKVRCTAMPLFFHPHEPLSLETRTGIDFALERYTEKWGGDHGSEKFKNPFDDNSIDFTYRHQTEP